MDDYQKDASTDFAKLLKGNGTLVGELIEILKKEVQPSGIQTPYNGSHYPAIMTCIYAFNQRPIIYAKSLEVNPLVTGKQLTPQTAISAHFDSFTVSKTTGRPRGEKSYIPPYFMWFCSLPEKCENDETRNRHEIAKNFYNKVLRETQIKIPNSLKIWDENWSPPWIGAKLYPVFHTWEEVRDKIEGNRGPGPGPGPTPVPDDETAEIERDILDPYNPNGIPFFGRENEIRQLNDFAYDKAKFKIWSVIAPSGAGKTRLVFEWTQRSEIKEYWRVYYLGQTPKGELIFHDPDHVYKEPHLAHLYFKDVLENGSDWQYWSPEHDVVLIIDYISGFEEIINAIVNRCVRKNSGLSKKVRLLILDHVFPESLKNLDDDERWRPVHDLARKGVFYDEHPLIITETDDQTEVIEGIIRSVALRPRDGGANINLTDEMVKKAINYLQDTEEVKGAWHPLFAALVGDALRSDRCYNQLDRRKLIESYLDDKNRLPWKYPVRADKTTNLEESNNRLWASAIIATATLCAGAKWFDLIDAEYPKVRNMPTAFSHIKTLCERVISRRIKEDVPPFIPDIIGESFFLLFLKKLQDVPDMKLVFNQMLVGNNKHADSQNALNFVSVMHRLIRNLHNDLQSLNETQNDWDILKSFLNPTNYPKNSPFRWAVSTTLFTAYEQVKSDRAKINTGSKGEYIEPSDFFESIYQRDMLPKFDATDDLIISAGISAVKYYKTHWEQSKQTDYLSDLESFLKRYDAVRPKTPALHLSVWVDFLPLVNLLIDAGYDLSHADSEARTALMIASQRNQKDIVDSLILRTPNFNDVCNNKYTALMYACFGRNEEIALELIRRMQFVDHKDADGFTALMHAANNGLDRVFFALLSAGAQVDSRANWGQNAFYLACGSGSLTIVRAMISRNINVNKFAWMGQTPIHLASSNGHLEVVEALVHAGADINAVFWYYMIEETALDFALKGGHSDVADFLRSHGAVQACDPEAQEWLRDTERHKAYR